MFSAPSYLVNAPSQSPPPPSLAAPIPIHSPVRQPCLKPHQGTADRFMQQPLSTTLHHISKRDHATEALQPIQQRDRALAEDSTVQQRNTPNCKALTQQISCKCIANIGSLMVILPQLLMASILSNHGLSHCPASADPVSMPGYRLKGSVKTCCPPIAQDKTALSTSQPACLLSFLPYLLPASQ